MMSKIIDLPSATAQQILTVASNFVEIEKIVVFGSRVLGNAKKGSDIDIALFGKGITPRIVARFSYLLNEETTIPYFMDILHYEGSKNVELKAHIDDYGVELRNI